jgi:hypothetical protein
MSATIRVKDNGPLLIIEGEVKLVDMEGNEIPLAKRRSAAAAARR